jgi:hypothetical protein
MKTPLENSLKSAIKFGILHDTAPGVVYVGGKISDPLIVAISRTPVEASLESGFNISRSPCLGACSQIPFKAEKSSLVVMIPFEILAVPLASSG